MVVGVASEESTVGVRGRRIVLAADTVEDVLAVLGRVGHGGVADLDAEHVRTHEAAMKCQMDADWMKRRRKLTCAIRSLAGRFRCCRCC